MKKHQILLTFIILALSLPSLAADERESAIEDIGRRFYSHFKFTARFYGYEINDLDDIRGNFSEYLEEVDQQGRLIVFPAHLSPYVCHYHPGEAISALQKTQSLRVLASDSWEHNTADLARTQNERLEIQMAPILEVLEGLKSASVDAFYFDNVNRLMELSLGGKGLDPFFKELNRTLKRKGKVYLSWSGTPNRDTTFLNRFSDCVMHRPCCKTGQQLVRRIFGW